MTIDIRAGAGDEGKPLSHFWSECVGAGRACEGLRAGWLEHLELARAECDFRYLRFHGLLHDDMFVYRCRDGREEYNFQYVDELFDRMLALGIRPFVELGFCPPDLSSGDETLFWWKGRVSPPKDLAAWARLVEALARHWIDRYGLEEVRQWYFEVWNEPNLPFFFAGTRSEYFELYRHSAEALKRVDGELRVGGPATSNFVFDDRFEGDESRPAGTIADEDIDRVEWKGVWILELMAFCRDEGLPLDFISTHPYPTDFALTPEGNRKGRSRKVDATREDLAWLRKAVDEGPFPEAEIHCTEWSCSPNSRDRTHDTLPAATYAVKVNLESTGLVDSLSWWVFTDVFEENGAGWEPFHGGFGLINFQGIPKPSFHAYRMLNALGDEELARTDGAVATRRTADGALATLAYHYPAEYGKSPEMTRTHAGAAEIEATGETRDLQVEWTGLPAGAAVVIETLDDVSGNALTAWESMGRPDPPGLEQTRALREAAMTTRTVHTKADRDGRVVVDREMTPWSLVLVRQLT